MMKFAIINQSDLDISELEPLIQSMMSFGQDRLGFQDPPSLFLRSDSENASDFLGKTGLETPKRHFEVHFARIGSPCTELSW